MSAAPIVSQLDMLSEVIIETIRRLSSENEEITPKQLSFALSQNRVFKTLLRDKGILTASTGSPAREKPESEREHPSRAPAKAVRAPEAYFVRLQALCSTIAALQAKSDTDGHSDPSTLQAAVKESKDVDDLLAIAESCLRSLELNIASLSNEFDQCTLFLEGTKENMLEFETYLQTSLLSRQRESKANASFSSAIDQHVQDIAASICTSKSLLELSQFIEGRVPAIRAIVEKKKQYDENSLKESTQEIHALKQRLRSMEDQIARLRVEMKTLEHEAELDTLTGIYNRRAYERRIEHEFNRYQLQNKAFSLFLVDVDHFKSINDTHGHIIGDRCLKELAKLVEGCLRERDFLARYGGEEFAVIGSRIDPSHISAIGERIRQRVERTSFRTKGSEIQLTVSIGATIVRSTDKSIEEVVERADVALYEAKERGRNRLVVV